jgi:hypothetical protein
MFPYTFHGQHFSPYLSKEFTVLYDGVWAGWGLDNDHTRFLRLDCHLFLRLHHYLTGTPSVSVMNTNHGEIPNVLKVSLTVVWYEPKLECGYKFYWKYQILNLKKTCPAVKRGQMDRRTHGRRGMKHSLLAIVRRKPATKVKSFLCLVRQH